MGAGEVEPVAYFVQTEWIGKRLAVAPRDCGVIGLKGLVQNPCADEDAEDTVVIGNADENCEDHDVNQALEELAVVHGADAGDDAQNRGCYRIGRTCGRRDKRLLIGLPGYGAGLAENLPPGGIANAVGAERFAAILAVRCCSDILVIYAVHTVLLSRAVPAEPPRAKAELPLKWMPDSNAASAV